MTVRIGTLTGRAPTAWFQAVRAASRAACEAGGTWASSSASEGPVPGAAEKAAAASIRALSMVWWQNNYPPAKFPSDYDGAALTAFARRTHGFCRRPPGPDRRTANWVLSEALQGLAPPEAAERLRRESDDIAARALALLNPAEPSTFSDAARGAARADRRRRARRARRAVAIDLRYPEESVGRLMERHSGSSPRDEGRRRHREPARARADSLHHVHLRDRCRERLVGVLAFRELLFARPRAAAGGDHAAGSVLAAAGDAARRCDADRRERHYPAYPVTDDAGRLVGMVRGQTLFERQAYEISAQAGSMVGVEKEERVATPWWRSFRSRHPWLQLNLLTAFIAAAVVGVFQGTVDRIVVLAAFLPVLAGQSGNSGCQALAVTLRGMTLGDLRNVRTRGWS